jgi:hypothetical protein
LFSSLIMALAMHKFALVKRHLHPCPIGIRVLVRAGASMLTTFHASERHSSSLDLHLGPLPPVRAFFFSGWRFLFFLAGAGTGGSCSSSSSSPPHSSFLLEVVLVLFLRVR